MRALLAVMTIVLGPGSVVWAGPLASEEVSAEAKWLVHVDVDAMKAGTVPRKVGELLMKLPSAPADLKKFSKAVGIDPTRDLHGITIYSDRHNQPEAVVIVRAEVDRQRLTGLLQIRPGYRSETYGSHELIAWTENEGKQDEHTVTGCFYRPGVVVFGRDAALVKKALDVCDGSSPGLTQSAPLFVGGVPAGTMVQARATGLADAQQFRSPLVQQSKSLLVALGERDDEAFILARLVTESEDVARRVQAVVEGLRAMAELLFDSDEAMLKTLAAVEVSTDAKTVTVECRGPADDLARLVEQAWIKQQKSK